MTEDYLDDVDLRTLLTTIVENLHAVSHFILQYARETTKDKARAFPPAVYYIQPLVPK